MENPKLFISYSWSSPEHEQWVLQLAVELRESGVDVILDKWDLREGHDAYVFMEKMVTDPEIKKVIIVCDKKYAEKANDRSGGVGTETQIISKEVYEKTDQNKFVAIVVEKDENGKACLPIYYKSRIYIDFSDQDLYATNFEQLLRWIYDKPLYIKPELGKKPSFLSDSDGATLSTGAKFKRALDAIRNNKEYADGAVSEYFGSIVNGLEKFRILDCTGEFDEKVINSIEQFVPYRNETIEIFTSLAQYKNIKETHRQIHRFFEQLIPYLDAPEGIRSFSDWDFDNFKFITHELFLYCVAVFIKHECFNAVGYLLRQRFYIKRNSEYGRTVMQGFGIFRNYLKSLEYRNQRLKLGRLSLHADLLKQRCTVIDITFDQLMQADFLLFLKNRLDALKENTEWWWPETLVYQARGGGIFEIFSRAESGEFFNELKCIFDIKEKNEFIPLFEAFKSGELRVPEWEFRVLDPKETMGFDKLVTRT